MVHINQSNVNSERKDAWKSCSKFVPSNFIIFLMGMEIVMKYYEAFILFDTIIFQLPLLILCGCGLLDVWATLIR